jgi:hypothetical protein
MTAPIACDFRAGLNAAANDELRGARRARLQTFPPSVKAGQQRRDMPEQSAS